MIAALLEACRFCAEPENRGCVAQTLGQPQYVNTTAAALRESLDGAAVTTGASEFPGLEAAHEPSADKAAWVLHHLHESGLLPASATLRTTQASEIFRINTFKQAFRRYQDYETNSSFTHATN